VAQCLGLGGERLMRLRNGWFQRRIPRNTIALSDSVIGFDTASWILAKRTRELGRPFVLDRTTAHRATRAAIRKALRADAPLPDESSSSNGGVQDALESEEFALATRIVVASRFAEQSLLNARIPAEKITVIPYGVNSDMYAGDENQQRSSDRLVFLYVGHLTLEKGMGVLLDAWRRLGAAEAELWLAGGGDPEWIERARSTAKVRILGKLGPEALREAYRSASVFVFPTYCDGFGMVLLEAMASGLPIVATPHSAAPELIQDETAGLVCPAGDAIALCSALADACSNRQRWNARGRAAREIAKNYTWENYGLRWAALLREVAR